AIDDHDVVRGARVDDREDAEELVDAGRREIHELLRATARAAWHARRRRDVVERRLELRASLGERMRGVQLAHVEIRWSVLNRRCRVADGRLEHVAERM